MNENKLLIRLIVSGMIIFILLACMVQTLQPPSTPEVQRSMPPTKRIVITQQQSSFTERPTSSSTRSPVISSSPTNTELPPLPDFADVLTFGGGGAEFGCEEYPPNADQIRVEGAGYGSLSVLCVFMKSVDASVPIRLRLYQIGGGGIELWSRDLIFDVNRQMVLWEGYSFRLYDQIIEMGGIIDSWEDGNVKFALAIQLPLGLPTGEWQITIDRPGGVPVSEVFQIFKETGASYINALDTRSRRELKPGWCCGKNPQLLQFPDHESLIVMGTDYPPNTPVYVLVYKELDMGGYELFTNRVMVSDERGMIWGDISETFEEGSYILYGITNPDTLLSGDDYASCRNALGTVSGAACDYFIVMGM